MATTMEPKRHLSRWHIVPPATADGVDTTDAIAPDVSLRYLNEFVGKLQCAAALLDHKLYPDAKEITESMGVFNAVRKYILHDEHENAAATATARDASNTTTNRPDGIVVVGDGSTPRTAAMFAHRLRHWKSYSIDPAMEFRSSDRSVKWESIANLVLVRNKIENVRITLRKAIVVLVHAHVTLDQALSAVDAHEIVGVVTLPCCNWFREHEFLCNRPPDLVYDDFSILSDKREVRVWVNCNSKSGTEIAIPRAEANVCVRKAFCASGKSSDVSRNTDALLTDATTTIDATAAAAVETKRLHVLAIFKRLLLEVAPTDNDDTAAAVAVDRNEHLLPAALLERLERSQHMLVLETSPATNSRRTGGAMQLLQHGFKHVYVLGAPCDDPAATNADAELEGAMTVPLLQLTLDTTKQQQQQTDGTDVDVVQVTCCGAFRIAARAVASSDCNADNDDGDDDLMRADSFVVSFTAAASANAFQGLDCVIDHRFVYRGFRSESRNAPLFRQLCALVYRVAAASTTPSTTLLFVCITPRKNWRKKEYLSHEALQFALERVALAPPTRSAIAWDLAHRAARDQTLTFVFLCRRIARSTVDCVLAAEALATHQRAKDAVLAMQQLLTQDARAVRAALEATGVCVRSELSLLDVLAIAPLAAAVDVSVGANRTYVHVVGQITNVRRYSKGMAFVSLAPAVETYKRVDDVDMEDDAVSKDAFDPRTPLQAFLQLHELAWPTTQFYDVLQLLHPGDDVRVLGFLKLSDRGTPVLAVAAIELVRGAFAAYD